MNLSESGDGIRTSPWAERVENGVGADPSSIGTRYTKLRTES